MKNKNFIDALKNTINGIKYAYKTCVNLRIETIIALIVIILSICLKVTIVEGAILTITIFMVLVCEIINSAIEETVDLITEEYNEKAKNAKDLAGGAVSIVSLNSIIVGILILGSKILMIIQK